MHSAIVTKLVPLDLATQSKQNMTIGILVVCVCIDVWDIVQGVSSGT